MKFELIKGDLEKIKQDVESIEDIDSKKIQELVIGFQVWGVPTTRSCQGHTDARPYPWLMISSLKYVREVARILCEWNYRQGRQPKNITWVIDPMAESMIRPLVEKHSLEALQKDAINFGLFLQDLPEDFDWVGLWAEE